MTIEIRSLVPDEWESLRELRLEALRTEPGVYGASYDESAARPETSWRQMLEATDRQTFGLFDGERLVGITGVLTARENPSGRTAMLVMSFIQPAYRGRGLSRLFYSARLEWVARQGKFDRVVVSHRRSNEASRRANQHFGFVPKEVASRTWPDGTVEDELSYELGL